MAKFTGADMTLTIGGNAITCLQSVETDERLDVYQVSCAGGTNKENVGGLKSSRMSITFAVETDDVTVLNYVEPGDTGAVVFKPHGAVMGDIQIDATASIVSGRRLSSPVEGIVIASAEIELDSLAITAHS
jgi:hypothetical protein